MLNPCYGSQDVLGECYDRDLVWKGPSPGCVTFGGGFLPGVVQFFNRSNKTITGTRNDSLITIKWRSLGQLWSVQKTEFGLGDFLWALDAPVVSALPGGKQRPSGHYIGYHNVDCSPAEGSSSDESSVGISSDEGSSDDDDEPVTTSGCYVRVMAFNGSYTGASSDGSFVVGTPSSSDDAVDTVPTFAHAVNILCPDAQASADLFGIDPVALETCLELGWDGTLKRVFRGGETECDLNPCVWDRDNPPKGTAGVTVPVIVKPENSITGDDLSIHLMHFDCFGKHLKDCPYAAFGGCVIETDEDEFFCPCADFACVKVDGGMVAECPGTVTFTCEEAAQEHADPGPKEKCFGDETVGICNYGVVPGFVCSPELVPPAEILGDNGTYVSRDDSTGAGEPAPPLDCLYLSEDECFRPGESSS